ncbi:MAG TPA: hypothetical protein VHI98_16795 [Vicinamibacterales bacterium]|nr:hypothetical protein [Vicinamibacterales bacterium]
MEAKVSRRPDGSGATRGAAGQVRQPAVRRLALDGTLVEPAPGSRRVAQILVVLTEVRDFGDEAPVLALNVLPTPAPLQSHAIQNPHV